jgi:hypothetical protein
VYEDQESGVHILDDDIEGGDIINLNRFNEINNEYAQGQERRQQHFRERNLRLSNSNML